MTALDVLAAIGTDVALMMLNGIAQKLKFKGLQDKAREKIQSIAEARGLTTEELEDRLAPDLGLVNKGWRRGDAQDGGWIGWFLKPLGGNKVIELNLDPGFAVGYVDEDPEQELTEIRTGAREQWGGLQEPEPFATLDPIAASELIRDMEALCA